MTKKRDRELGIDTRRFHTAFDQKLYSGLGRIAIANSDAAASAYTDAAIDEAHRAVQELLQRS